MFSLRQAFHASVAAVCGVAMGVSLEAHQPEWVGVEALAIVANVIFAGYRSGPS